MRTSKQPPPRQVLALRLVCALALLAALHPAAWPVGLQQALAQAALAAKSAAPLAQLAGLRQALTYEPWQTRWWLEAGRAALQTGRLEEAGALWQRAGLAGAADWLALGDAWLAAGDFEQAQQAWLAAEAQGADSAERLLRQAHLARLQGQDAAEVTALEAYVGLRPLAIEEHIRLILLLAATRPEAALARLTQLQAIDADAAGRLAGLQRSLNSGLTVGDPAYTLTVTGRELAQLGEWRLARLALSQAVALRPDYGEAWAFLGEALQQLDPADPQALTALQRGVELSPDSPGPNSLLALYWARQQQYDKALVYLQAAQIADPNNPVWMHEIANTYAAQGDLPAAQAAYQQAILLSPQRMAGWQALAEFSLRFQVQVGELALPAAQAVLELAPNDPNALVLMGRVQFGLGDYAAARAYFDQALAADPDNAPAHLHLAVLLLYHGDAPAAHEELLLARELALDGAQAEQAERLLAHYFP